MIEPNEIIYLDNNATTQLDPAVIEEMRPFLEKFYGNPSSGYQFGAQVREAVEMARDRVATLLGCLPNEIIFTGCGTESNNTTLNAALQLDPARQHVVTSTVEHSAITKHCEQLVRRGCALTALGVDESGNLDLDEFERAIRPDTAIVSLMWANNETGVLFPIEKLAEIAHRKRVLFHTDAIQAVGKIPIRVAETKINFLSLSGHKLHAPKGVGALYLNRRAAFRPTLFGGSQENGRRAGTENVASIVGLGKAAELAAEELADEQTRVRAMRDRFEETILTRVPESFVNGDRAARLPNTSSISFAGIESDAALVMLDQQNLCCSAGSACRTGSLEVSHVLRAMNLGADRLRGSLRFSFGRFNTDVDVDKAIAIVPRVIEKLRAMSPRQVVVAAA